MNVPIYRLGGISTALVAVPAFAACTTPLPRPNADVPPSFASGADLSRTTESVDSRWWETFHDPVLNQLVAAAWRSQH